MAIANVGSVAVDVVPDTQNFGRDLRAKLLPEATRIGTELGRAMREGINLGLRGIRVDINTAEAERQIAALQAQLAALRGLNPDIDVRVHGALARAELERLKEQIGSLEVDIAFLLAELAALSQELNSVGTSAGGAGLGIGFANAGMGTLAITAGIVLVPALIPLVAVLGLITGGLIAVGVAATAGLGALALAIIPTIKSATTNYKALQKAQLAVANAATPKAHAAALARLKTITAQTTPGQIALAQVIGGVSVAFKKFSDALAPTVIPLIAAGVKVLTLGLGALVPVAKAAAPAVASLLSSLGKALAGPGFKAFIAFLDKTTGPAILGIGKVIGSLFAGFGSLVAAFGPTGLQILKGLGDFLSGAGNAGKSSGFQAFMAYAKANLPAVKKLLGDTFTAVAGIIQTLAPLGPVALKTLNVVISWISQTFLPALKTALPGVVGFIEGLILEFSILVKFLLYGVFGPIINGAADAFGWIHGIGDTLKAAQEKFNIFADTVTQALDDAATAAGQLQTDLNNLDVVNATPRVDLRFLVNGKPAPPGFIGPTLSLSQQSIGNINKLTKVRRQAEGGIVQGPGSGTSDSIPTLLSNGEFVMTAAAVSRMGSSFFDQINAGGGAAGHTFNITNPPQVTAEEQILAALRKQQLLYPVG